MNKVNLMTLVGLLLACSFFTFGGTELDQINAAVAATAAQMDKDHGVLLTGQERNDLKIKLVATNVVNAVLSDGSTTVSGKVDEAIDVYQITDPVDRRQLLIEVQSTLDANGDGLEPPK